MLVERASVFLCQCGTIHFGPSICWFLLIHWMFSLLLRCVCLSPGSLWILTAFSTHAHTDTHLQSVSLTQSRSQRKWSLGRWDRAAGRALPLCELTCSAPRVAEPLQPVGRRASHRVSEHFPGKTIGRFVYKLRQIGKVWAVAAVFDFPPTLGCNQACHSWTGLLWWLALRGSAKVQKVCLKRKLGLDEKHLAKKKGLLSDTHTQLGFTVVGFEQE